MYTAYPIPNPIGEIIELTVTGLPLVNILRGSVGLPTILFKSCFHMSANLTFNTMHLCNIKSEFYMFTNDLSLQFVVVLYVSMDTTTGKKLHLCIAHCIANVWEHSFREYLWNFKGFSSSNVNQQTNKYWCDTNYVKIECRELFSFLSFLLFFHLAM